jgi:hypothetical protein
MRCSQHTCDSCFVIMLQASMLFSMFKLDIFTEMLWPRHSFLPHSSAVVFVSCRSHLDYI